MSQLTTTEQKIYNLLVNDAAKTKSIATMLGLSNRTVERYIDTVLEKKGVTTQKELIVQHYKEVLKGILCTNERNQ